MTYSVVLCADDGKGIIVGMIGPCEDWENGAAARNTVAAECCRST